MGATVAFEWDSSCALGLPIVDEQHQEFFRLANHLLAASKQKDAEAHARESLDGLIDYACYHVHTEEEMLELHHYPQEALRAHRKEHEMFTEKVKELRRQVYDGKEILNDTITFVTRWLLAHITRRDIEYAEHIRRSSGPDL